MSMTDGTYDYQGQHDDSASEQLQEAFRDFDVEKKGYLTLQDLELFCSSTLGMEKDQVPSLFTQLDQDRDGRVTFQDFCDHWESVTQRRGTDRQQEVDGTVCSTQAHPSTSGLLLTPDSDEDDKTEVEPKYVLNKKRFGRRSRPENDFMLNQRHSPVGTPQRPKDLGSPDLASQMGSIKSSSLLARFGLGDTGHASPLIQRRTFSFGRGTDGSPKLGRTIESISPAIVAESQDFVFRTEDNDESVCWDPSSLYTLSSQSPTGDELSMIKTVFETYDVDHDGLISKQDLSEVCDSLGMTQTEEQLSELFDMLDEDRDGQVTLDDFCKKLTVVKETYELESPTSASQALLFEVATSTPLSSHGHARVPTPALIGTNLLAKKSAVVEDLFHRLDTDHKGLVQRDTLISMWMEQRGDPHNEQHQQITRFLQGLETNENGHVSVEEVTFGMQAALMDDQGRDIRDPVLRIYLTGIRHLRSRLVTVQLEYDKLQTDFTALAEQKARLVRMGDEEADQLRREHRHMRENDELKFQDKIQQLDREHRHEQEMVEQQAQKQIRQLEEEIKNLKLVDDNLKLKMRDLDDDKQALEKELQQGADEKESLERVIEQLQRELEDQEIVRSTTELHMAMDDNEKDGSTEELQRQLSELARENSELRDVVDEHAAEIGLYKQQIIHERRKSQRESRRRRSSGGNASAIRRSGSKVGDYMKKRKESASGSTSADDTDGSCPKSRDDGVVLSPTPPGFERSTADGGSSEDEVIVRQHEDEDYDDEEILIAKYVERIKELESEKSHVEAGFQETLEKKTVHLQQQNQQLTAEREDLVAAKNKLVAQVLALQTTADVSATANSEMQTMAIERQELRLKAQHLEIRLADVQDTNQGMRQENEELKAMTQELRADCSQLLSDIDKQEKEIRQLKVHYDADLKLEQDRLTKQFDTSVSELQQEAKNVQADMCALRKEHAEELNKQKQQFGEDVEEAKHQVGECRAQIDELQSSLEGITVVKEELEAKASALMQENQELRQRHDSDMKEAQVRLSELQQEVENLQADRQSLKNENEETRQKQKEQLVEEKKALELSLSEIHDRRLRETEEARHQVTKEGKAQIVELQTGLEQMRVMNEGLELKASALTQETIQLSTFLEEASVANGKLEKELQDSLAEVRQQIVVLTSENKTLQTQIEQNANMAAEQHSQMASRLSELEVRKDHLVRDREHLEEQLADLQEDLSSISQEKDHWQSQADVLEQTISERDQSIRELKEDSFVGSEMEEEMVQLQRENSRLKGDLKEQIQYSTNVETILGRYSAESTEQRLIEKTARKQRLEQLEEENKSLRRELTPLKRQQNLYRFSPARTERGVEALKLENSALNRALTTSSKNERELNTKCQELTMQKQALLKLICQLSLSSVH